MPVDNWTFLTNHSHALLAIARDPEIRLRDVAAQIGITERAAQRIVAELMQEGFVVSERRGRRNRYTVQADRPFRHPLEGEYSVAEMLKLFTRKPKGKRVLSRGVSQSGSPTRNRRS